MADCIAVYFSLDIRKFESIRYEYSCTYRKSLLCDLFDSFDFVWCGILSDKQVGYRLQFSNSCNNCSNCACATHRIEHNPKGKRQRYAAGFDGKEKDDKQMINNCEKGMAF